MKTIGRILVILAAALVVIGATWAVGRNSSSSTSTFDRAERPAFSSAEGRPAPPDGASRERDGDHHAAQPFSLRGWLGFAQTLVPMMMIITLVVLPTSLWKKRRRARREEASALPA
jgi:hypothetical protein